MHWFLNYWGWTAPRVGRVVDRSATGVSLEILRAASGAAVALLFAQGLAFNWDGQRQTALTYVAMFGGAALAAGICVRTWVAIDRRKQTRPPRLGDLAPLPQPRAPVASPGAPRSPVIQQTAVARTANPEALRAKLQKECGAGRRLLAGINPLNLTVIGGVPTTTQSDVREWVLRVRAILKRHPDLLDRFDYQKPVNPMLNIGIRNVMEPAHKRELQRRLAQLDSIIEGL